MAAFVDWFPCALVGLMLTVFGAMKLYGVWRGVVGGRDRPALQRLCGT